LRPPHTPTSSARWTTRPAIATTGRPRTSPTFPARPSTGSSAELPLGSSQIFIVAWGEAVASFGAEHSPLRGRDARFIVHPLVAWEDPADDERMSALGRAICDDVLPWALESTYPNFLGEEGAARMRAAFGDGAARLEAIKAHWDPRGMFRTHQDLRPRLAAA
jgi:FAD/FMN-containing dehydrogenase